MRLFLAVELDEPTREELGRHVATIKARAGESARAFKWTATANLHVTLHFLGEVPFERVGTLQAAMSEPLPAAAFTASLDGVGTFPERGAPRVLWIGIHDGAQELRALHAGLGCRLGAAGFDVDPRPLSPHVTLARVRDDHRREAARVAETVRGSAGPPLRWRVDRVTLFRSDLSSGPPKYVPLAHTALAGTVP